MLTQIAEDSPHSGKGVSHDANSGNSDNTPEEKDYTI
jgi:hypothetical protein